MPHLNLSAWANHRIPRLARTFADLVVSRETQFTYLVDALQYRPKLTMG
jgi:predicted ATPase with chaperone activity